LSSVEASRRAYKLIRLTTRSRRVAEVFAPPPPAVKLERDYELFFPIFNNAFELFTLASVPDWRARCRVAVCFINEVWAHDMPDRYLMELLSDFDHVFVGLQHPVEEIARLTGRPCSYLPMAVDVLRFAPPSPAPARAIDVCGIGRRSPVTHEALLRLALDHRIFYYYDTVAASGAGRRDRTFHVDKANDHRLLLASLLQRSRYFIANRSLVNVPELTMGHEEIGQRFYEGAAAGTVMLGEPPRTAEFRRQFDWRDAVIPVPFDSPDIGDILSELDRDRDRVARISRANVYQAALRHDWVYRLRTIFETVGIRPTSAMREREARLQALGALVREESAGDGLTRLAAAL